MFTPVFSPHSSVRVFSYSLGLCTALLLSGCGGAGPSSPSAPAAPPPAPAPAGPPKLTIEAYIDGRSRLILRENTAQWHHLTFAAPGRLNGANLPTRFNESVSWLPTWADQPTSENRDCDCRSDVFAGVTPPIPRQAIEAQISGRSAGTVVQAPNASNDFTLILEFNDTVGGAGSHTATIYW